MGASGRLAALGDPEGRRDDALTYDAIVIGAGANGLVTAHLLAKAGRKVLVLEQHTGEPASRDIGWIPPQVIADLSLTKAGLTIDTADPWAAIALEGGGRLELSSNLPRAAEAIGRLSARDAAKWPEFCARMHKVASVLAALYSQPAPDVETTEPGELLRLGLLGLRVKGLGRQGMIDLLRLLPMSVADLLDEWFENDALKAALGIAGVMHLRQGPRSGATAFNFLHHHVGSPPGVFRLPASNLGHVLAGLPGVEVRRGAKVMRIRVAQGRAGGVVLENGDELAASLVISSADPRATLLGNAGAGLARSRLHSRGGQHQVPRRRGAGQPHPGHRAVVQDPLRGAVADLPGARLRRREIRPRIGEPLARGPSQWTAGGRARAVRAAYDQRRQRARRCRGAEAGRTCSGACVSPSPRARC